MIKPGRFKIVTTVAGLAIIALLFTSCSTTEAPRSTPTSVSINTPVPPAIDTPTPASTPVPPVIDTPTPIPTPTPAPRVIPGLNSTPVVQYSADADRVLAQLLVDEKAYNIARTTSEEVLETSTKWILVGGQFDNRIYGDHFEDITLRDSGFINIAKTRFTDEGIEREIWGVAGWTRIDKGMSIQWMIDNVLPNDAQRLPYVVVQYCPEGDRGIATRLSDAFGWPLVNTCSLQDLDEYDGWILIGGQFANPVFKEVFGDALVQQDAGYTVINITGHVLNEKRRIVWGLAGWNESDSIASIDYVLERGLPEAGFRNKR